MAPAPDHDELCNSLKRSYFDGSSDDIYEEVSKKPRHKCDNAELVAIPSRFVSEDLNITTLDNLPDFGGPRNSPFVTHRS
jgi:hypothetical protein